MARSNMRVKVHGKRYPEFMAGAPAQALLDQMGKAVADACNAESSWGGYHYAVHVDERRARVHIWSADRRNDEARDQRLIRNLDAAGGAG